MSAWSARPEGPGPTPGRSAITDFVTEGDISIVGGDATTAYPEELGLTQFHRWLVLAAARRRQSSGWRV